MSGLKHQILSPEKLSWRNGVPYSERFSDIYSSQSGLVEESTHVFIKLNQLQTRWADACHFKIGEIGFGLGVNFLTTVSEWPNTASKDALLHYWSVEKYPLSKCDIELVQDQLTNFPALTPTFISRYPSLISGAHRILFPEWRVVLTLHFSDALYALKQSEGSFDAWYLDGFSPLKNQELWSEELFRKINRLSHQNTTLATYSVAGKVRENLAAAGFECRKVAGFGTKAESLVAAVKEDLPAEHRSSPWFSLPISKFNSKEVIVIGAGLAGSAAAFSLGMRGYQVTLLEAAGSIASGASGNPQGALVPYLSLDPSKLSRFYLQGLSGAIAYIAFIADASGRRFWHQTGSLQLPSSERLKRSFEVLEEKALNSEFVRLLDQDEASEKAGLRLHSPAAYFPNAGFTAPKECCQAALNFFNDRIKVLTDSEVATLDWKDEKWFAKRIDGSEIASAPLCIVANGMGAAKYPQTNWLPLEPVRGRISQIAKTDSSSPLAKVLCYDGYVFPEVGGSHVIGATFEHGNFSTQSSPLESRLLLERLSKWIDLSPTPEIVNSRVSFRVSTHDRLPYIGAVPDPAKFLENYKDIKRGFAVSHYANAEHLPGLYVSLGHGSRGLISSWLAAEIISALIQSEPLPLERDLIDAVNPARFLIKKLQKN